jgi:hypothetical protein
VPPVCVCPCAELWCGNGRSGSPCWAAQAFKAYYHSLVRWQQPTGVCFVPGFLGVFWGGGRGTYCNKNAPCWAVEALKAYYHSLVRWQQPTGVCCTWVSGSLGGGEHAATKTHLAGLLRPSRLNITAWSDGSSPQVCAVPGFLGGGRGTCCNKNAPCWAVQAFKAYYHTLV